jgi:hypothetical protein
VLVVHGVLGVTQGFLRLAFSLLQRALDLLLWAAKGLTRFTLDFAGCILIVPLIWSEFMCS